MEIDTKDFEDFLLNIIHADKLDKKALNAVYYSDTPEEALKKYNSDIATNLAEKNSG